MVRIGWGYITGAGGTETGNFLVQKRGGGGRGGIFGMQQGGGGGSVLARCRLQAVQEIVHFFVYIICY